MRGGSILPVQNLLFEFEQRILAAQRARPSACCAAGGLRRIGAIRALASGGCALQHDLECVLLGRVAEGVVRLHDVGQREAMAD